jgi:probable O-glycosylation ligase (exosortase A-associated)
MFMPDSWEHRMKSIENYEQDSSAMGRINTWKMAFNLANARPLVGGGFEPYTRRVFQEYAPNPDDVHSAHSIYFQLLGEHGYVGLLLFLVLGGIGWVTARRIIVQSRGKAEHTWAANLARAIQVSLVAFGVGGAFVNISYWDLTYYELIVLTVAHRLVGAASGAGGEVDANPANAPRAVLS